MKSALRIFDLRAVTGILPIVMTLITLVLGVIGWSLQSYDGSSHSVAVICFKVLGNLRPNLTNLDNGNGFTEAAAIAGLFTVYLSALLILATLLRETRRQVFARLFYKDHVLVIGDTPLARRVADLWNDRESRTLQIIAREDNRKADFRRRTVRKSLDEGIISAVSAHRARHVFVDLGDEGQTLTFVHRCMKELAARSSVASTAGEWVIVARDGDLIEFFEDRLNTMRLEMRQGALPSLFFVDPERLAARQLLAQTPLFALAQGRKQKKIHAFIVGFGSLAQHLLELIFLCSLVDGLDRPLVTVFVDKADWQKSRFFTGRSSLESAIDVAFYDPDVLTDAQTQPIETVADFRSRMGDAPITAAFLTGETLRENLPFAQRLWSLRSATGDWDAPIFVRDDERWGDDPSSSALRETRFSFFSLDDDFLEGQICEPSQRDAAPRALHESYAQAQRISGRQPVDWLDLSEAVRRSNRNAADHALAKIYSLGFDVRDVPAGSLPSLSDHDADALRLEAADASGSGDTAFDRVVRLEHERWMLERFFTGWCHAEERDDMRRRHPLLVSWESLIKGHPSIVAKDVRQIEALVDCLNRYGNSRLTLIRRASMPDAACDVASSTRDLSVSAIQGQDMKPSA